MAAAVTAAVGLAAAGREAAAGWATAAVATVAAVATMNRATEADAAGQRRAGDSSPDATDDSDEGLTLLEELRVEEPLPRHARLGATPGEAAAERALTACSRSGRGGGVLTGRGGGAEGGAGGGTRGGGRRSRGRGGATHCNKSRRGVARRARAEGAAGVLVKGMVKWAMAKPEHDIARSENAEGAGASERATEPTSRRRSARAHGQCSSSASSASRGRTARGRWHQGLRSRQRWRRERGG